MFFKVQTMICLCLIIGVTGALEEVRQTDWHEGPGVIGPVTEWTAGFNSSNNINYLYEWGRISLAADISISPIKHHIGDLPLVRDIHVGDVDRDGDMDIMVLAHGNGIHVFINDGSGNFSHPADNPRVPWDSYEFTTIDLDKDGDIDILGDYDGDNCIYWWKNDGTGHFTSHNIGYQYQADGVGAADFDLDGDLDLVASAWDSNTPLSWWENTGSMNFTEHRLLNSYNNGSLSGYQPVGDFTGNGYPGFICSNPGGPGGFDVWLNNGGQPISFTKTSLQNGYYSYFQWVIDLDKDGDLDIIASTAREGTNNQLDWWENNNGSFIQRTIKNNYLPAGTYAAWVGNGVTGIDLNVDGGIDIVMADHGGSALDWWENTGNQNFSRRTFAPGYNGAYTVWTADFNKDGFIDIASDASNTGSVDWWDMIEGFFTPGELVSSVLDVGMEVKWYAITWNATTPPGTAVKFQVRAGNDPTNMGEWSPPITQSGTDLGKYICDNCRCIQYKAILETTDPRYSPLLYDVSFWFGYSDVGVVSIKSPRDTVLANSTITPKATIKNFSPISGAEDFHVICRIDSVQTQVYADTQHVDYLNFLDTLTINFDPRQMGGSGSTYNFIFFTLLDDDADASNDTLNKIIVPAAAIGETPAAITTSGLFIISPNPTGNEIELSYQLSQRCPMNLCIYDVNGRLVRTLATGLKGPGKENLIWNKRGDNGRTVDAGVYFLHLETKTSSMSKKVVVIR
jgi:hypothetical protein